MICLSDLSDSGLIVPDVFNFISRCALNPIVPNFELSTTTSGVAHRYPDPDLWPNPYRMLSFEYYDIVQCIRVLLIIQCV